MRGYKNFEGIQVGDRVEYAKTMTEAETYIGVGLIGALNPVHIDEEYCKKTRFKSRMGVGLLVNALSVSAVENFMVGPGTQLVSLDATFVAPVYFNDTIKAIVEVTGKDPEKHTVSFKHEMINQDGKVVLAGQFTVKVMEGDSNV